MTDSYATRPARPRDAAAIVRTIAAAFPQHRVGRTIYGCGGAARYVADHIAVPPPIAERRFYVGERGGEVHSCVELQRTAAGPFLSYIAVSAAARGRGLASRALLAALSDWVDAYAPEPDRIADMTLELDVFDDNPLARSWYERIGLVVRSTAEWRERPNIASAPIRASTRIAGWPAATAMLERYGFGHLSVHTLRSDYAVGLLGNDTFRLTDAHAAADPDLLGALHRLAPTRRVLTVAREGSDSDHGPLLARTHRMSNDLRSTLSELRTRTSHTRS